jgi:D-lactate dehydrogenase
VDAAEVGGLLRASAAQGVPLTLRSGGTSLSGQAVTDGVLVDVRKHFKAIEVLDGGTRVRVQPGVTVRMLNARLARYGRKFGPDPASEMACTIGGVVANNSSGMHCGTEDNAYRTLEGVPRTSPHLLLTRLGLNPALAAVAGAVATECRSRELGLLCVRRRPRNAPPRAHRVRHPEAGSGGRGVRSRVPCLVQPDVRAGNDPGHGERYQHVLELLDEVSRNP